MLTFARIAEEVRRREDTRLVNLVRHYAATACPFPVTVYVTDSTARHPEGSLVVRAAGTTLVEVGLYEHHTAPEHPSAKAAAIGLAAARAYAALEPLEHDHQLGTE